LGERGEKMKCPGCDKECELDEDILFPAWVCGDCSTIYFNPEDWIFEYNYEMRLQEEKIRKERRNV